MITRGIVCPNTGKKDYQITHEGHSYFCARVGKGQKFSCEPFGEGTIRQIKEWIEQNKMLENANLKPKGSWYSDPASMLAIMYMRLRPSELEQTGVDPKDIEHALDCNGYLDENGEVSFEEALTVYTNMYKKRKDQ